MFEFLRATTPPLVERTKLSSFVRDASSGEKKQVGWRQLPWRRDDNYLGGLNTGAGPVREAGLS
jgi:hypothetical protein